MSVVTLSIDGVLLLGIICVSVYGARILAAGAELPLHFGPAGYTNWQPRNFALVMWPALAVVVYVIVAVTGRSHHAHGGHGLPLPVGLTAVLAIMLVNHVGAVRAALNRSGRDRGDADLGQ
jgi:hypothetical protein